MVGSFYPPYTNGLVTHATRPHRIDTTYLLYDRPTVYRFILRKDFWSFKTRSYRIVRGLNSNNANIYFYQEAYPFQFSNPLCFFNCFSILCLLKTDQIQLISYKRYLEYSNTRSMETIYPSPRAEVSPIS